MCRLCAKKAHRSRWRADGTDMEPQRPFPVAATVVAGLAIMAASLVPVVSGDRADGGRLATVDRSRGLRSAAVGGRSVHDGTGSTIAALAFNEMAGQMPDGSASGGAVSGEVDHVEAWPEQWIAVPDSTLARHAPPTSSSTSTSSTSSFPTSSSPTSSSPTSSSSSSTRGSSADAAPATASLAEVPSTTSDASPESTTTAPPVTPTPSEAPVASIPAEAPPASTPAPPGTQPSQTRPPATEAQPTRASGGGGGNAGLEALRNTAGSFGRFASVPTAQLDLGALTEAAPRKDNGSVGDGQFRIACQYSHFAYDDPIVFPGQPGRSHLHMFFGNTGVSAHTTTDTLLDSGGGTCNGFELNRSGYWIPALLDGRGNAVVPEKIIIYYKTTRPGQVHPLPQDLKIIAGNPDRDSFEASNELFWSCGKNGHAYNKTNRIPDCGGDVINASIVFPQCWDGHNFDSADHRSHMVSVNTEVDCPGGHPIRFPQISILVYWPGQPSVDGWHLSSDRSGGFNSGPGATLHADWWGGWNDDAMNLWIDGCMRAARNCSFGQTGTDRALVRINNLQNYPGPYILPLP